MMSKAQTGAAIEALFTPMMEVTPPPGLGFAHGALDRSAQMRGKADVIDALRRAPDTRFYSFCGDNAVLKKNDVR